MPVSVVCETAASVNAALRESLGNGGGGGTCSAAANAKQSSSSQPDDSKQNGTSNNSDDIDSLHGKLVASAKRVLLSKIDYEEVTNYGQSVLDSLKSKYIVLKSTGSNNNNSMENGRSSPATCNNNGANGDGAAGKHANGNNTSAGNSGVGGTPAKKPNPNELPAPKRILYPRENVRIGWKATGRKWEVGVGMTNVGNTCYLNSTLQALFHVPSLANWLMSDTAHMERCESTDAGCIICAMAKTLQESQRSQSAIRPYYVYSKLKSICKHLVMGRQEDAHEFLRYLVEAMEKSYLSRFRNHKELDQYSKETTPLNQILGGYLKSAVRCLACNHVSVTFQHFQDLLLDIRKADTVDEALEGYFSRERLEDMGYKCEACKKKVSATKQFSLERAPIALCIQLKRFSMLGTKLNKQITIKPRLDLTKFASRKTPGEQLTYHLVAMVTHLGASQHCGHYTAIGLTESGTYYNYDDSYVRPISMQNVCNTNAYIIFYEMDTQPPRNVTSTQVSGAQATAVSGSIVNQKDNAGQALKVNGHINSNGPQRLIGPQLPSGYNTNVNAGSVTSSSPSPLSNGGSKLLLNRNSTSTSLASSSSNSLNSGGGNSKIMIHFKNNNSNSSNSSNLVKTSAATSSITSASATSTSSCSTFDNLKNGNSTTNYNVNGLHLAGTGKFQESANTKYTLGITTTKRQVNNIKNSNESSSDDDDEDEIVSSSTSSHNATQATLPSMPKLGVDSSTNTTSSTSSSLNAASTTTPTKTLVNGIVKKSPAPIKSLVPYGSETDDETDVCMATATKATATPTEQHQQKRLLLPNPLKRRQSSSSSSSSSSDNDVDTNDRDMKPTNGIKIKKAASSTSNNSVNSKSPTKTVDSQKKASDTIDEIFNSIKRSNNTNNNINSTSSSIASLKKKSQNQQFTVTSTTTTTNSADFSTSSSDSEDESNAKSSTNTRPPFKRSHSTPPSPPVVKTNSGIWQVTSLQPITACVSPTAPASSTSFPTPAASEKTPKNSKNPFAKQPAPLVTENAKRLKKENSNKTFAGNGYQRNTSGNESAVSELLKQSHRGYGAPVLTWSGQQSEIDKETFYLFDEKRIEDDSLDNNAIDNNGNNNDHDHCHDFTDEQLKYPTTKNNDDVDHYLTQNEKHLNTYHSDDINITSAIVSNEQEDIKLNITPITLTSSNFKEENDQASDSIMANTASESLSSPADAIDSENCLNSTDELQQMIDDEMENIDSGVYATSTSSVAATNFLRFSLISSTTAMPTTTTSTATPKPFEFDEDALDNL